MNHRDIEGLLADYADGRLSHSEPGPLAIEEHLRSCDSCRAWLETYRLISEHRDALHPDSHHLAARAAGEPVPDDVLDHLGTCAACWQLVADGSRALEKAGFHRAESTAPRFKRAPFWLAAAAMLWLSLVFLIPRPESPDVDSQALRWAGPGPVLVLSAVTRQAEADEKLVLRKDQAYVAIGLDLGARLDRLKGQVEIELSRGPGEVVWEESWTPEDLADVAADGGLLMLYWPREFLEPAAVYEVRVRDAHDEAPWQRRFVVNHGPE